jgi:hypothetical protein
MSVNFVWSKFYSHFPKKINSYLVSVSDKLLAYVVKAQKWLRPISEMSSYPWKFVAILSGSFF